MWNFSRRDFGLGVIFVIAWLLLIVTDFNQYPLRRNYTGETRDLTGNEEAWKELEKQYALSWESVTESWIENKIPPASKPYQRRILEDVYFTVKTAKKYHDSRVQLILKTWWRELKRQTYFFTDTEDQKLGLQLGDHLVTTQCGGTHKKYDLCCKMGVEYDYFYESGKSWWCHVDDDNYVNPDALSAVLEGYDRESPWYLGRLSRNFDQIRKYREHGEREPVAFRFATGGAGVCITRVMASLMEPWMRNGNFVRTCQNLGETDDMTFGFIVTNRLGKNITIQNSFNSHLQDLSKIKDPLSQAVLSYSDGLKNGHVNVIQLADDVAAFSSEQDPTRMLSYHCWKYPNTDWCSRTRST